MRVIVGTVLLLQPLAAMALSVQPLSLGGLGSAGQPNVVADERHGSFVLSWQARLDDGCAALRVAELAVNGELGAVHQVARGCDWFVNWADFPALVVADNGDWLTYWLRKTADDTYAYEIRSARSLDRGKSWSQPLVPHDDGTPTEHGFVSMAPAGGERVRMVWLDGRDSGGAGHGAGHDHHEGNMTVRSAVLDRRGVVPGSAALLDERACSCCATDLVRMPGRSGHMAVFRDRSEDEVRDIHSARHDGRRWWPVARVHADNWKIAACPVNGPALAVRADGAMLTAWSTMPEAGQLAVRARRIDSAAPLRTLEQGAAVVGRVDASAFADGWLLGWLGADAASRGGTVLRVAVADAALERWQPFDIAQLPASRNIGMPRLAALGDVAVLVWTQSESGRAANARSATRIHAVLLRATEGVRARPD